MHITNKIVIMFLILLFHTNLMGQEKRWTIDECIRYALDNSLRINNQKVQNKIYDYNYREAAAKMLPEVVAKTDANFNFGRGLNSETNIYTDVNTFSNNYQLYSSVVLFDGLVNITRVKLEKANKLMGNHQLKYVKDMVAFETMEAFFNALYYKEMETLAIEQLHESRNNLNRVKRMEELGMKSYPEVAELAAKEAADSYNYTKQKNQYRISIIRLKEKMHYPINRELHIGDYTHSKLIIKTNETAFIIYEQNGFSLPKAQAAIMALKTHELSHRIAKGTLFPVISLDAGFLTNFSRFMDNSKYIPFNEQLKNKRGYYIGFSLSIPVFQNLRRQSNLGRSKQQLIMAHNTKEQILREIYTEIEEAIADMNGQADEYLQANRQEEAMRVAHQLNLRNFEEGLISAMDLHTSANRYLQAKIEKINSELKFYIKYYLFNYYKGISFVNN